MILFINRDGSFYLFCYLACKCRLPTVSFAAKRASPVKMGKCSAKPVIPESLLLHPMIRHPSLMKV
ncbi:MULTISPECIES: hypothetical protein [unclassified Endozoicomonas]|uniref:hypothetical protein n=1 Tax=unclassified Endozoicomonas TaxID=2644528 RepID=UPI003BB5F7CC